MTTETAPQPNVTVEHLLDALDHVADYPRMLVEAAVAEERDRILVALKKTYLSHNIWVVRNIVNGKPPYGNR